MRIVRGRGIKSIIISSIGIDVIVLMTRIRILLLMLRQRERLVVLVGAAVPRRQLAWEWVPPFGEP